MENELADLFYLDMIDDTSYNVAAKIIAELKLPRLFLKDIRYILTPDKFEINKAASEVIYQCSGHIKNIIRKIYHDNNAIYDLEPREFESVIAELLKNQNYKVELTKQTHDGGYDIIAVKNLDGIPLRFLVECKRYGRHRPVGIEVVRSFCEVISTDKSMGMLVTTSYFSRFATAYKIQHHPHLLHFKDHQDIIDWIKKYHVTECGFESLFN